MKNPKVYYIIDDDADDQQFLIEALLANQPLNSCFTALDGKEGISQLLEGTVPLPDAIFLDLNMPVMNGKECLQQLKNSLALKHIPVIIYSTGSDAGERNKMIQTGAAHYLVKAVSHKGLRFDLSAILSDMHLV